MRKPQSALTHETLLEEARFILRTLQREDLFGDRIRLTEAERIVDTSISLNFVDYCGFLNKFGYLRVDQVSNHIEVTEGGKAAAHDVDDAEFQARLSRHFQRELGTHALVRTRDVDSARPFRSSLPSPGLAGAAEEVVDRRYRRGELIGTGTIGSVFRSQHLALGRAVAIKEARSIFQFASYLRRDEVVRRLRSAVESNARLFHPGIIAIFDQNADREHPYWVMEHAPGGNLRQRMSQGDFGVERALRVIVQIAHALAHAHAAGVAHLAIKPENVLFDAFGNAKLTDFGLARVTERVDEGVTAPMLLGAGTVAYLAPERLNSLSVEFDQAADIYSFGILAYELLVGKLPGRRSPMPSKARPEVPEAFDEVFDRMTRDELSERYKSMSEVLEGLHAALPKVPGVVAGTITLWAVDPSPLKQTDVIEVKEIKTDEIEVVDDMSPPTQPPRKRTPPPPPTASLSSKRKNKSGEDNARTD